MFSHVRVGSNDLEKSRAFYDNVLGALGIQGQEMHGMLMYQQDGGRYLVGKPIAGAATGANGGTIGFKAGSPEAVDKFHAAGLANGGTSDGEPGVRAGINAYGAYLRDPDGNKMCAFAWGG